MNKTTILCYGDSNTWGWVPNKLGAERFDEHTRWPGVLRDILGDEYTIAEEGLGARTASIDEPRQDIFPLRNGLQMLPVTLEIHAPVDIVILMLGTADLKPLFSVSPESVRDGIRQNIEVIRHFKEINGKTPRHIILVAPPILDDTAPLASKIFTNSREKSEALIPLYEALAKDMGCIFVDSNLHAAVDPAEGIHLAADSHKKLGKALADVVGTLS